MSIRDRLQAIADNLPANASITLTRSDLVQLLGGQPGSENGSVVRDRDLKTEEVAAIFDVKPGTVLDWLHRGKFGAEGVGWYKLGRRYFIRRDAVKDPVPSSLMPAKERFALPRQRAAR